MAGTSLEERIREAIGRALERKNQDASGKIDIDDLSRQTGVSQDQVKEQFNWLLRQNLIQGPMKFEGEQIGDVPAGWYDQHSLTDRGRAWARRGYRN